MGKIVCSEFTGKGESKKFCLDSRHLKKKNIKTNKTVKTIGISPSSIEHVQQS